MKFFIREDTITPRLARIARNLGDRKPVLEAMGIAVQSHTVEAFSQLVPRPAPWPPKRDGSPSNLTETTALRQSIRVVRVTSRKVVVGTDRVYAAVHQFGSSKTSGRGSGIPPRPFFPWVDGRMTPDARRRVKEAAEARIRSLMR